MKKTDEKKRKETDGEKKDKMYGISG